MTMRTIALVAIAAVILAALMSAAYFYKGGTGDVSETIKDTLVGTNLTYYSIAGKPMNYTIGTEDVGAIEPTTYKGKDAWKVRVGQSLAWDLTMDASGKEILYVDQLFRT